MFNVRTLARSSAVAALAAVSITMTQAPAQADPVVPIDWNVDVTSHLAALDKDVVIPTGTFIGGFDLATGKITGDLGLEPSTTRLDIGSLPLASVTMAMEQTAPVTGSLDLATMDAETTSTFNVHVVAIRPVIAPWLNLVNRNCLTRTPVSSTLKGKVDLASGSTFTGTYDLPKFSRCGFGVNAIINQIVSGPGNGITAVFTPRQ